MLSGKDNSGFGWDEYRQMVVAKCAMWNSYISNVATTNDLEKGNNYQDVKMMLLG
ncbi:hypothetical protein Gohar_010499 [Gossypium harknessii]|uniref:Myb/SANT-like domain-containing protein n=1 Tax=Gossypium harknessii TaxID=34285 RepID=A0A7J9GR57_9ROSI|nr:hypothetical protein [Gossypium harknessii]